MTPDEERLNQMRQTLKEAKQMSYRFSFTNDDIEFLLKYIEQLLLRMNPPDWDMS